MQEGNAPEPHDRDGKDDTNATNPAPLPVPTTERTQASEREARRPRNGTEAGPPAHQETGTPLAAAWLTTETADTLPAAPAPPGPKAANTCNYEPAPAASTEETTVASAPAAHPTAMPRPANNRD